VVGWSSGILTVVICGTYNYTSMPGPQYQLPDEPHILKRKKLLLAPFCRKSAFNGTFFIPPMFGFQGFARDLVDTNVITRSTSLTRLLYQGIFESLYIAGQSKHLLRIHSNLIVSLVFYRYIATVYHFKPY
jgi:hypothetical protein